MYEIEIVFPNGSVQTMVADSFDFAHRVKQTLEADGMRVTVYDR